MNPIDDHPADGRARTALSVLAVALLVYGAVLWIYRADVAGGADSSGYLNAARLLSHGVIRIEPRIPEGVTSDPRIFKAFIPFGFRAGLDDRTMVPVYSIGLPIQMAAATMLLGEARGPFVVVPLLAILGVALVYRLGRQFELPRSWAAFGAMVLALSPIYVFQGLQPMSDLPSTVWVLAAVVAALEARRDERFSLLAGFAFGLAVVTRPTSTLAVIALLIALPWTLRSFVMLGTGGMPWAAFLLGFNTLAYGNPFQTGYGSNSQAAIYMSLGFLPERLRHYGLWMMALFTPWLVAGWLASPAVRSIDAKRRWVLVTWLATYIVFYGMYKIYDQWWATRFLLPGAPALIVGGLVAAHRALRRREEHRASAASTRFLHVAIAVMAAVSVAWLGVGNARLRTFAIRDQERVYRESVRWADERIPAGSVVVTGLVSGSAFYYSDLTVVNHATVGTRFLVRIRKDTEPQGHPWYALVFPGEIVEVKKKVPGDWQKLGNFAQVELWQRVPRLSVDPEPGADPSSGRASDEPV